MTYDGEPYPGIIQEVEDDQLEVNVLHNIGRNRFFWPLIQDVLWYNVNKFVTLIPQPSKIVSRHLQIEPSMWKKIETLLDI